MTTWAAEFTDSNCTVANLFSSPRKGIDKLTEKSQVSEDGTMVSVPKSDASHGVHADQSAAAGTSDTESNSGRDNEVDLPNS